MTEERTQWLEEWIVDNVTEEAGRRRAERHHRLCRLGWSSKTKDNGKNDKLIAKGGKRG